MTCFALPVQGVPVRQTGVNGPIVTCPRRPAWLAEPATAGMTSARSAVTTTARTRPKLPLLEELVRDAREDDVRLEEEEALDVERALVMEQPRPAPHDHLGQDDVDDGVRIGGQFTQVGEQRCAD